MKSILKTTIFIASLSVLAFQIDNIGNELRQSYDNCVRFIANNAYVPTRF